MTKTADKQPAEPKTAAEQRAELNQKYEALNNRRDKANAKLAKLNEALRQKINAPQLEERRTVCIDLFLADEEQTTVLDVENLVLMEGPENEAAQAQCNAANDAVPATDIEVRKRLVSIGYVDCPPEACAQIPGGIIPGLVYRHPACIAARDNAENAGATWSAHRAATVLARETLDADLKALEARKTKMLSF